LMELEMDMEFVFWKYGVSAGLCRATSRRHA
jgi:hypothetical protein